MNNYGTFSQLKPASLLKHLSSSFDTTSVQVISNSVSWRIYLEQGKITYATHSVEPFDRLERHLRRLSVQIPNVNSEIRIQMRMLFEGDSPSQPGGQQEVQLPLDYQAICWLIGEKHISGSQAAILIQELVKEVMESFLLIQAGNFQLKANTSRLPRICRLDVEKTLLFCQQRLDAWNFLAPQFTSPFQRPYLWMKTANQNVNLPGVEENLTDWMKGFSLRHLAVMTNQDELKLARTLYPHILNGTILLHEPDPPFDLLPKTFEETSVTFGEKPSVSVKDTVVRIPVPQPVNLPTVKAPVSQQVESGVTPVREKTELATTTKRKVYKIVSVDDSPTILKEISRFLEDENFSVVTIDDPLKAVMSVIRHRPDLILLDLNMEGIDGYELCRLIRNNAMFKNTPIVMVTGNKGLVDKVRARFVGASGYLTKPFTRAELLKIVFTHLA
ncbi:MAG: response regulator [Calothrix sp. SM1_7_51]|nr:response regulator [Calothrix sp. SM1_7_51]